MWNKSDQKTLFILMPFVISIAISMDIFIPSIPDIGIYFHQAPNIVQWTLSIYMIGSGIGQLISGPLTDRFGRRPCALIGLLIYLIGTMTCLFAPTIDLLILGRLFQSLGSCALIVVAYAIVRDIYSTQKGAILYSQLGSITMVAPVLAPILGGYLSILFNSWRASFVFLLLFGIFSFILSYVSITETLTPEKRLQIRVKSLIQNYLAVLKNRKFLTHSLITLTCLTALFIFCALSPFLLMSQLKLNKPSYGIAFGTNAITYIIASLISTYLTKRIGMPKTIITGIFFTITGSFLMLIVNITIGLTIINFMLPMLTLSFGLGLSFGPATAQALSDFSNLAGTASALLTAIQFLGAGIFGSIITAYDVYSAVPFASLMLFLTLLSLVVFIVNRKY